MLQHENLWLSVQSAVPPSMVLHNATVGLPAVVGMYSDVATVVPQCANDMSIRNASQLGVLVDMRSWYNYKMSAQPTPTPIRLIRGVSMTPTAIA